MERNLDEEAVRRIWEYDIKPSIEDQFFGDREQIDRFRFDEVYKRYRASSDSDEETAVEEPVEAVDGADAAGDDATAV